MNDKIVTDTHALIWYLEDSEQLSPAVKNLFDQCNDGAVEIFVPTICLVELVYLAEKERIPQKLQREVLLEICEGATNFMPVDLTPSIVLSLEQIPRSDVPDMPDRIIAATALHLNLPLITRDKKISFSQIESIW